MCNKIYRSHDSLDLLAVIQQSNTTFKFEQLRPEESCTMWSQFTNVITDGQSDRRTSCIARGTCASATCRAKNQTKV